MAVDLVVQQSRRAVIAAGAGALAALVAHALGRPLPARAEGEAVVVGGEYTTATSRTYIENGANNEVVLKGRSQGGGTGVEGSSASGVGVRGGSNSSFGVIGGSNQNVGVWGQSSATDQAGTVGLSVDDSTGVMGISEKFTIPPTPAKTGVYGYAVQGTDSRGVWGRSNAGRGVYGQAGGGMGVRGFASSGLGGSFEATSGVALHARGRVQLDKASGTGTIATGTRSRTVTPGFDLTTGTKVLVSLLGNPGGSTVVQRIAVNASADTFTVYLTANATASTKFAWLVLV
jgi:hypothetical protein